MPFSLLGVPPTFGSNYMKFDIAVLIYQIDDQGQQSTSHTWNMLENC